MDCAPVGVQLTSPFPIRPGKRREEQGAMDSNSSPLSFFLPDETGPGLSLSFPIC